MSMIPRGAASIACYADAWELAEKGRGTQERHVHGGNAGDRGENIQGPVNTIVFCHASRPHRGNAEMI